MRWPWSSARRRRRLSLIATLAAAALAVTLIVVLIPSRGGEGDLPPDFLTAHSLGPTQLQRDVMFADAFIRDVVARRNLRVRQNELSSGYRSRHANSSLLQIPVEPLAAGPARFVVTYADAHKTDLYVQEPRTVPPPTQYYDVTVLDVGRKRLIDAIRDVGVIEPVVGYFPYGPNPQRGHVNWTLAVTMYALIGLIASALFGTAAASYLRSRRAVRTFSYPPKEMPTLPGSDAPEDERGDARQETMRHGSE